MENLRKDDEWIRKRRDRSKRLKVGEMVERLPGNSQYGNFKR